MAVRSVFKRSPLGSRRKSPLGAFIAKAETQLEIFSVPLYLEDGLTFVVTGEYFGDTQGTGTLVVSNREDGSDINVTQTVSSWTDTLLTFTFDDGGTLTEDGPVWIVVTNDDGQFDAAVTQIPIIAGLILGGDATTPGFGPNDGLIVAGVIADSCPSFFFPLYCGPAFRIDLTDSGYGPSSSFLVNSPGFSIVGQFSGKTVTLDQAAFVSAASNNRYIWASPSEGIAAHGGYNPGETFDVSVLYFFSSCAPNTGGYTSCAADPGGWDFTSPGPGEDVYLLPTHPITVQILSPANGGTVVADSDVTLDGFSYSGEGDISASIDWYVDDGGGETFIDTGASVTWPAPAAGSYDLYARVTNAAGQARFTTISVTAVPLTLEGVFPLLGNEAGGARVFITGSGFTMSTTIEFDGNASPSVTFYDSTTLLAVAPAGTGSVDVTADSGAATAADQFVYDAGVTDIFVDSITPDDGPTSGGTSVTISGSGFNANCTVIIGGLPADNIVIVDPTEITCDIPDGTGEPGVPGAVHVAVVDEVVGNGCVLPYGFTYT